MAQSLKNNLSAIPATAQRGFFWWAEENIEKNIKPGVDEWNKESFDVDQILLRTINHIFVYLMFTSW